jgi:uncharacterized protein YdaU (DUF1376 family)
VNFIKLFIGDYLRDTGHLSIAEHGAYLLMLQHFYATEKPLPVGKALHRLLRAESKTDRDAIDAIARLFWTETDGGLVNQRGLREFARTEEVAATNRAIALAREARKRATKTARSVHESCTDEERSVHEKSTSHSHSHSQTKDNSVGNSALRNPTHATPAGEISLALRKNGVASNPMDPRLIALAEAGTTPAQAEAAAQAARDTKGDGARIPPAYVFAILERWKAEPATMPVALQNPDEIAAQAVRMMAERGDHASQ